MDEQELLPPLLESSDDESGGNVGAGELEYRGTINASPEYKKSCTPEDCQFNDHPPFVEAVVKKGEPKFCNSVPGYCFGQASAELGIIVTPLRTDSCA